MKAIVRPSSLHGEISVPGSKSHTIRAIILSALSDGVSKIRNPLESEDCLSAVRVVKEFGAKVNITPDAWEVDGFASRPKTPENIVDVGNSGSVLYFMTSVAALLSDWSFFTGDESIRTRPVRKLLDALQQLGAEGFTSRTNIDAAPYAIRGKVRGGEVTIDGQLSQYVTSILLIAPMLHGQTKINVTNPKEKPFLKMTVDWLKMHNIELDYDQKGYTYFLIPGEQKYFSINKTIPADWGSASFPLVAALVTKSNITIRDLDMSAGQGDAKLVDVLIKMGAAIKINKEKNQINIVGPNQLRGLDVNCSDFPDAIPIISVAAAFAKGTTRLTDIAMVRLKETDRINIMCKELRKMGVEISETGDSLIINGNGGQLTGTEVDSHKDHRVAMALSVAGLFAKGVTTIKDAESCAVTFPDFYGRMKNIGANIILEN